MNKTLNSCFRRSANLHWGLWALAAAVGPAIAQPTGNPKGSAPVTMEGNSAKAPATRNRNAGSEEERRTEDRAGGSTSKASRAGHLRTPGVGTAGGLTGRHPGDGSANRTTETDQAPPAKKR
ncbi:hypothetical protein H4CHR_05981 [Variovorax sp. PBS-H4]|uniref:hypothetical protein n=1 Tax=Variovorax sp. PBS-H4 TaxID=434008 RepID=UPI001317B824|nr:hypothetical protein [Variovorax sp. PBS-H4]VTU41246.1 hypothetical protein H4CHR_05981 [Variovorax sp. PBS-H4]